MIDRWKRFTYWHDRIVVLKPLFDEATPQTLTQLWADQDNGVQWYTFWVAIAVFCLTMIFGLLQSITGIMQVYVAFHPVKAS